MGALVHDVRFALRGLRRQPGFAVTTVLILALGFGVNSTMMSVALGLFSSPQPGIHQPDALVRVNRANENTQSASFSYPDYAYYRDQNQTFTGFTGYAAGLTTLTAEVDDRFIPARAQLVAANFFDVMGIAMAEGRRFGPDEARAPDQAPVIIVSHAFRNRELGRAAIGDRVLLNGRPYELIGVVGPEFTQVGPTDAVPDVWLPLMMRSAVLQMSIPWTQRVPGETDVWIQGIGRLQPGTTLDQARADMVRLASNLEAAFPDWNAGQTVALQADFRYSAAVRQRLVNATRLLLAASALVFLIACANVGILMLSRAGARQQEFGVRAAIGASRARLIRQMLAESGVLAGLATAVGLVLAFWSTGLAMSFFPVPLTSSLTPSPGVVIASVAAGALAAVLFGLTPAWLVSRPDLVTFIRKSALFGRWSFARHALVVVQVALAIMLTTSAGLFVKSLQRALNADVGFATTNRFSLTVNLENHGYNSLNGRTFVRTATERLAGLPSTTSVTTATRFPFSRRSWGGSFQVPGVEPPAGESAFDAEFDAVGPGYFSTMGLEILRGRGIEDRDDRGTARVVVVNETLARLVWGTQDPVGRTLQRGQLTFEVVGVVETSTYYSLGEDPTPYMFFALQQIYQPAVTFVIHSEIASATVLPAARDALLGLDRSLAISNAETVESVIARVTHRYRVNAGLLSLFGVLALVLAGLGLYGVMTYLVSLRTQELGIRLALGARQDQLGRAVLLNAMRLISVGIGIGIPLSLFLTQSLRSFLFGVAPGDPVTFGLVPLLLLVVGLVASYLPANRASRVDPLTSLRDQ